MFREENLIDIRFGGISGILHGEWRKTYILADKHKIDILLANRIKQNENYNNDVYGPKDK